MSEILHNRFSLKREKIANSLADLIQDVVSGLLVTGPVAYGPQTAVREDS